MKTVIGVSGSLRKGSFNTSLLKAAAGLVPAGCRLDARTINAIPLYNGDVEEADGVPEAVEELKAAIAGADGLLIATPEYNNAMPGVLKNAVDWLTRPPKDIARVFGGKPLAVIGATPGGFGTVLSQASWLPVWRTLGVKPWYGGRLYVSRAHELFDEKGALKDKAVETQLRDFLKGFFASLG